MINKITKESFIELISNQINWETQIEKIGDVLDISNIYECNWIDYTNSLFNELLSIYFYKEGCEIISWWLYEKPHNEDLKMYDEYENEIPTKTLEDLWEIIKDYRKKLKNEQYDN